MKRERIVVAMSGGVDSAVAAARLHEQGFEVIGVTLHLWDYPDEGPGAHARCCAPEDQYDARRTADALGFPHYTFDRRKMFEQRIVAPFVEAYLEGRTPSPCTECNRGLKLGELFEIARRLGAERIATGHYARVVYERDAPFIARARDRDKDQSYFLYATPPDKIARLVFPLGESTKPEVRAEAIARKLPGAGKGESQELCFVGAGAGAYAAFVESRAKDRIRPGPIVDAEGRTVGEHAGIHRFTIGQRKGLGIAIGAPAFVTGIDPKTSTVKVGSEAALAAKGAELAHIVTHPNARSPIEGIVRVRYRHDGARGRLQDRFLRFDEPVRALSPGQVAVVYDGDRVVSGGTIVRAIA
jgi:tRNA-specific 2-thiouridylase